eukprot:scaffold120972_cov17-Tisochrysis_lutea.AAC.3
MGSSSNTAAVKETNQQRSPKAMQLGHRQFSHQHKESLRLAWDWARAAQIQYVCRRLGHGQRFAIDEGV